MDRLVIYLEDIETGSDSCRGGSRTAPTPKNILPFPGNHYDGYFFNGDQLNSLPIGSTLDGEGGVFYWQPGPGFIGEYRLVFIKKAVNGEKEKEKKMLNVVIKPKFAVDGQ